MTTRVSYSAGNALAAGRGVETLGYVTSVTIQLCTLVAFATGLAVALITVFVFQAWRVDAAPGDSDTTFVPITPCRLIDTRPAPLRVGTFGAFGIDDTKTIAAHGTNGDCTIPNDAVGLSLNVTAVGASQPTFLTVWPDGARPTASNLNPTPGQPPTPNVVATKQAGVGSFEVYNRFGSVDVIIDVGGYYTSSSLVEMNTRLNELSAQLREIELGYAPIFVSNFGQPADVQHDVNVTRFNGGSGTGQLSLSGPNLLGDVAYALSSVEYCVERVSSPAVVTRVRVESYGPLESDRSTASDETDRTAPGCYTLEVNNSTGTSHMLALEAGGAGGFFDVRSITVIWMPISAL